MDVWNILTRTLGPFFLAEMLFCITNEFYDFFEKNLENERVFVFSELVSQLQIDLQPQEMVLCENISGNFFGLNDHKNAFEHHIGHLESIWALAEMSFAPYVILAVASRLHRI